MKHTAILFLFLFGIYASATDVTGTISPETTPNAFNEDNYEYDVYYVPVPNTTHKIGNTPKWAKKVVFGKYEVRNDYDVTNEDTFYNPIFYSMRPIPGNWQGVKEIYLPTGRFSIDWYSFHSEELERVVLPDNVELRIGGPVFIRCYKFKEFVSMSTVPPDCAVWPGYIDVSETIDDLCYWFEEKDYANVTLIVPAGSEEAYRKARTWRLFPKIVGVEDIESYVETASITDIAADNADSAVIMPSAGGGVTVTSESAVQVEIYTPSGLLVTRRRVLGTETIPLQTGLYIIRTGSRTTKIRI